MVNTSPSYYSLNPEVSSIIRKWSMNFAEGSALKYLIRYKFKNHEEDLLKCMWYITDILENTYGVKDCNDFKEKIQRIEKHLKRSNGIKKKEKTVHS